jgi:hypothetical protein
MDPRNSPYAPGAGTTPITLAGRDDVLERFDVTLSRLEAGRPDVAPLITGSRGSGKTVLLNELVRNAQERGWFVASEEVIPGTSLSDLIAVLAHEVLLEMSRKQRVAANVRRVLGVLKAFTAVSALGVTLNIDVDAVTGTADTGIFSRDLRHLFIEIGNLARQQSVGVAFALDEIHTLRERELDDLNSALHQTAQRKLPVVLVGAGLFPSWQKSGSEGDDPMAISSYAARVSVSTYVRLEPLDAKSARRALVAPARTEQVAFTDEALDAAVGFSMGNAWVIQLVGSAAWEAAERSPIDLHNVRAATSHVEQQLNQWFFPRLLRNCSDEEISLLAVIANHLEDGVARFQSVEELAGLLGIKDRRELRGLISKLAQRDLIELQHLGRQIWDRESFSVRFSAPMLGNYLSQVADITTNAVDAAPLVDAAPAINVASPIGATPAVGRRSPVGDPGRRTTPVV